MWSFRPDTRPQHSTKSHEDEQKEEEEAEERVAMTTPSNTTMESKSSTIELSELGTTERQPLDQYRAENTSPTSSKTYSDYKNLNGSFCGRLMILLVLSLIAMGSLVGVTGMRQFFFDPIDNAGTNAAWFVVQLIPLLVPLPGFLRGGLTSTFILCLASMLYFIHGVMLAFHPDLAWLGYAEVFFALALTFTTALLTRKIREQQAR